MLFNVIAIIFKFENSDLLLNQQIKRVFSLLNSYYLIML